MNVSMLPVFRRRLGDAWVLVVIVERVDSDARCLSVCLSVHA